MRTTRRTVFGLMMAVVSGGLTACSAGSADPTGPGVGASTARGNDGQANGGGAASGGATAAGTLRLRCEVRPGRSKISVDGNNLSPRNGIFTARVASGANHAASPAAQAIGDEVEFDFDSATGEVGATRIAANFIVGGMVTAEIRSGEQIMLSGSAQCEVR